MSNKKKRGNKNNILKNKKVLISITSIMLVIAIALALVFNANGILAYFSNKNSAVNVFNIKTKYAVTFDANTGTGTMENKEISYNVPTNLTKNTFTKTDHEFKEWNTNSDGTGTVYADEAEVTNLGDITLYAQWEMNDIIPPTDVTFTIDEVTENSITVTASASDERGIKYFDASTDGGSTYPSGYRQTIETPTSGEASKTITLTGLNSGTEYTLRVKATDEAGNSTESSTQTQGTDHIWGTHAISAINSHTALQTIDYKPAANSSASVMIPGNNNGNLANQTFTQSNLGTQSLKWYVLNADSNGVNLVSQPTSKTIQFQDSGGYDNCLYYLNEIATKLFTNSGYGVDSSRTHAIRLTDIKNASEAMNGNSWSFDTTFLGGANKESTFQTEITVNDNRKYPQIYGTGAIGIRPNNQVYDEAVGGSGIPKSGDLIANASGASSLKLYDTWFCYNDSATCKTKLGTFGTSGVGKDLFNSSGTNYWLATRYVYPDSEYASFGLRNVVSGRVNYNFVVNSYGHTSSPNYACRVVVSVPGSKIKIAYDGTVTLK